MSRRASPAVIGSFVLGAVALLFVLLLGVAGDGIARRNHRGVAFFDGPVGGLEVGSPVTFLGVPVGRVAEIRLVADAGDPTRLAPAVAMELDRSTLDLLVAPADAGSPAAARIAGLIDRGLRARLVATGAAGGPPRLELGFHPESPARYRAPADGRAVEIPTIPPDLGRTGPDEPATAAEREALGELLLGLDSVVRSLDRLVAAQGGIDADRERRDAEAAEAAEALEQTLARLDVTLDRADGLLRRMDARFDPLMEDLDATLARVDVTMAGATDLIADLRRTASPDSELYFSANATLQELERSMRSLRAFLDFLDRHPEALLGGKEKR